MTHISKHIPVAIVGGGQAGLSISYYLQKMGIGHIVFEKHKAMHVWQNQRWDSFCLVTPNWQCQLPGYKYEGDDPDGFMTKPELNRWLEGFRQSVNAPLLEGVSVSRVVRQANGCFDLTTSAGPYTADQIVVAGNTSSKATYDNWRRVRSIRIGMVLRGPIGSQQEIVSQTFYPFGLAPNSSTGSAGTALSDSTNDPGTVFTPAADGRLRQVVTFTIHLRNDQSL